MAGRRVTESPVRGCTADDTAEMPNDRYKIQTPLLFAVTL
jgi:hypothetical protein